MPICVFCEAEKGSERHTVVIIGARPNCENRYHQITPCRGPNKSVSGRHARYCARCSEIYGICQICGEPFTADHPRYVSDE